MKLNDNSLYLYYILEAFEDTIMPELRSETAQLTAEVVKNCLQEIQRRETQSPALLIASNQQGFDLCREMEALITHSESNFESTKTMALSTELSFKTQSEINASLTKKMSLLARQLSALTERNDDLTSLLLKAAQWEHKLHTSIIQPLPEDAKNGQTKEALTLEQLKAFLITVHDDSDKIQVNNLQRVEGGFGKQTYFFTLVDQLGHEQQLVVRKSDSNPYVTRGAFIIDYEFHLLSAVANAGVLAPKPLWLGKDVSGIDGDFFIMERLPGKIPGSLLDAAAQIPEQYLLDVAAALAKLHNVELNHFVDCTQGYEPESLFNENITECYQRSIKEWRDYSAVASDRRSPVLEYLFDWLSHNVPINDNKPVLVHGDYNIHNILADNGRASAILDWELAMFGAPEQDLAYIKPHISQHIDWDTFVEHYLACGGKQLNLETLDFYMAFSAMRVLSGFGRLTQNFQSGVIKDLRLCMVEQGFIAQFMGLGLHSSTT